jgi:hypothetical protein
MNDREVLILTKNGVWLADGSEITHEPTRKLFARSLKHDEKGWFLAIGRETKRIQVEDTAFFVTRIDTAANGDSILSLSDSTQEVLHPSTLRYAPGRLSCRLQSQFEAKFMSAPYAEIMRGLEEDESGYFLRLGREKIVLSTRADGQMSR